MIIHILEKYTLNKFFLPSNIFGSYWITSDKYVNLINVEAINNQWIIRSNYDVKVIIGGNIQESVILSYYQFYYLQDVKSKEFIVLYCTPLYDNSFLDYQVKVDAPIVIGSSPNCQIRYACSFVGQEHATLEYINEKWNITSIEKNIVYVNYKTEINKTLKNGDSIFIGGLKIIVMDNYLIINNPNNLVGLDKRVFLQKNRDSIEFLPSKMEEDLYINFFNEEDYYSRAPRFRSSIEKVEINIDAPPAKIEPQDKPLVLTVGPMITMSMTSMVMMYTAINNMNNNNYTVDRVLPTLVMAGAMLLSVVLWPLVSASYEKRKLAKREALRQWKYKEYIDEKRKLIRSTIVTQKQILIENGIPTDKCQDIILRRQRSLWERKKDQDDFLQVRLGLGKMNPQIDIHYPEEQFKLEEDNLEDILQELIRESTEIMNVPIFLNLAEKNISAIMGKDELSKKFVDGLILQLMAYHGHDDLKIVLFTSRANESKWEYLRYLPHCWDNQRKVRFFATNQDEMKQISNYLESDFYQRKFIDEKDGQRERNQDYKTFNPYYLIITDNLNGASEIAIFKNVLKQKVNIGFSILMINDKLANLPNECSTFINISENSSGLFENELVSNKQKEFRADLFDNLDMMSCAKKLANIPLEFKSDDKGLPEMVSFLEMYNVGKVEQLNALNMWQMNSPVLSLQVPVGVDQNNGLFKLDLHEKFHGPHGLIAGMTGSGKSEFIITYILSLAINFHPYEVSFILIDYKGGGLAGAFFNKDTGVKLPHLAGVITNLDTIELKRSLSSLESELKRRQRIFNKARDMVGEGTIDIYKYQRLYRDGFVTEPVSHLFVICDEFAELKMQQPEFMTQLISIARIGRSLGLHLILATQKPSGIVDDQIWSNSRFRICLKVQDRSDSMDMIKRPDAALLKQTGRFYLQVGYNEYFAIGQSAWSGSQYYPTDKLRKKVDNSLELIDNTGYPVKKIEENRKVSLQSQGEELTNIIKYLSSVAIEHNIRIRQLWLDKIPNVIFVDNLKSKYNYSVIKFDLNPIIGEYDDPNNQRQDLLTLPLTKEGNTIIFGSPGSGKELLLSTIIYSIIVNHSVEEVNLYILDFGAETLRSFEDAPHIGDVLSLSDEEKIDNLFKLLLTQIDGRRDLFSKYNGSYIQYCKASGQTVPAIVVILNNYEAYVETYQNYDDTLAILTREGGKYGIYFVISVSGTNSIRFKLRQNFKQELVLQMNNEGDYLSLLGSSRGVRPTKTIGRGLIKLDQVYEFQTAYAYTPDNLTSYLRSISKKLDDIHEHEAFNIPILPDVVTIDIVKDYLKDLSQVPIGIQKNSLSVDVYDFKKRYTTIISSQDSELFRPFIMGLTRELVTLKNTQVIIIDADELLIAIRGAIYNNSNFDMIFNQVYDYIKKMYDEYVLNNYQKDAIGKYQKVVCIVLGIDRFKERLNKDNRDKFASFFEMGKDLDIINFILVDTVDRFKKLEIESWFRSINSFNNGIWIGNGIVEQFVIKLAKVPRGLREEIPDSFGYSIRNGNAVLTKLIEGEDNE